MTNSLRERLCVADLIRGGGRPGERPGGRTEVPVISNGAMCHTPTVLE